MSDLSKFDLFPVIKIPILGNTAGGFLVAGATRYAPLSGCDILFINSNDVRELMPVAGVLKTFYTRITIGPGAGESWVFTIMVEGVATAITCTITGAAVTASDLTHEAEINAGNRVEIRIVGSAAAGVSGNFMHGIEFNPKLG